MLTKEQSIKFCELEMYKFMSAREKAEFQVSQKMLCMPFPIYQDAMEISLGRPVMMHEFAYPELLKSELFGEKPAPSLSEILELIPDDKRWILIPL